MKKIFKILIGVFLFFVAIIIIIPLVFEDKIIELVKQTANNNINATLDFKNADLSIFSNFPSATVSLENISIVNKAPFVGDTLLFAKAIDLKLPLSDLFKSGSAIGITSFVVDGANVSIKVDKDGNANYDIAKKSDTPGAETQKESDSFELGLNSYEITNSKISYSDASSKINLELTDFNHSGSGNLSTEKSKLKTNTTTSASFQLDSVAYFNRNKLELEALFGIDLAENKYSFLENKALINQLPLIFDGFIKINKNNQDVKLTFKTPSSDFKNFLALIPEVYSKTLKALRPQVILM